MDHQLGGSDLALFSVSPNSEGAVLKPNFFASTSAFLKLSGRKLLLVGQANSPSSSIEFIADPSSVAVRLPLGFQTLLLHEPASEISNSVRFLHAPEITDLDTSLQVSALLAEMRGMIQTRYRQDKNISLVIGVARAAQQRPNLSVHEVTRICGYSSRQLQRIFLKYTGFTTKEFLEVLRFEITVAWSNSRSLAKPGFKNDFGQYYYDQSHFIKDFRRFSGQTPRQLSRAMSDFYNTGTQFPFILDSN